MIALSIDRRDRRSARRASPALLALCLVLGACSSRRATSAAADPGKAAAVDCNSTAGSVACPPDPKDPSGKKLPRSGGVCALPTCKPCGSAQAPAFRDSTGAPQPGWCMCIPKSDDSGDATYSCFTASDWARRGQ